MSFDPHTGYGQILAFSRDAFAAGHAEVAYHLLMGCLHAAQTSGDTERLQEVAGAARSMLRALDESDPPHPLGTLGSQKRGTSNIFMSAVRMAENVIKMLQAERLVERELDSRHVA